LSAARENNPVPVYIGLGANIDPEVNFPEAMALLQHHLWVEDCSTVWESPPVGSDGPNFLNAVVLVYSELPAAALRNELLRPVETALGRVRGPDPNSPRTIDLDILIFGDQVLEPEIWVRAHLSVPLAELLPDCRNPETGETLEQVALRLSRQVNLKPRQDVRLKCFPGLP
jgi:2-amino-4-hydroxy-6-hydroxymethyldihydropteridine diphosphokinase